MQLKCALRFITYGLKINDYLIEFRVKTIIDMNGILTIIKYLNQTFTQSITICF